VALGPQLSLTPVQTADLEIHRAVREGVDGFNADAWAGGNLSKSTLDALFAATEAGIQPDGVAAC
jgi:hypothetical protein